jgi:hypothetical protein
LPADVRSDIYAAAIMLFELLCGRRPYVADSLPAVLALHLDARVPDPRSIVPDIGDALAALCRAGLAKDPAERPQTAAAFLGALEEAARQRYGAAWATGLGLGALVGGGLGLGATSGARTAPYVARAGRLSRRALIRLAAGGTAATAVVAGVLISIAVRHHSTPRAAAPPIPAATISRTTAPPTRTSTTPSPAALTGRFVVTVPAGPTATRTSVDELIDASGRVITRYPAATAVCCYGRALSPDGRSVLDLGEGMLQVGPAAGPARTIWSTPNGVISAAAWSPNGQLIAFALTDESTPVPTSDLDVIGVATAQPEVVAKGTNIHSIAWSPDGTRIAFLQNQGDIWLVPAGGGAVTSVRTPQTMLPNTLAWSPGPQLVFDETGTSPTGVWTVAADGSGLRVLVPGATSPSWAPGGNYFAAVRGGRVVIADRAGRVERKVGPAHARRVQWGGSG